MRRENFRKRVKESIMKQIKIDVAKENLNLEYTNCSIDNTLYVLEESLKLSKIHDIEPVLNRSFSGDTIIIYSVKYYIDLKNTERYTIQKELIIELN